MNKVDRFYDQADKAYRVGSLRLYSKSFAEAPFTVLFGLLFITWNEFVPALAATTHLQVCVLIRLPDQTKANPDQITRQGLAEFIMRR